MIMAPLRSKTQMCNQRGRRNLVKIPVTNQHKASKAETPADEVANSKTGMAPKAPRMELFDHTASEHAENPLEEPGLDEFVNSYAAASQSSFIAKKNRPQSSSNAQQLLKSDAVIKDKNQNSLTLLNEDLGDFKQKGIAQGPAESVVKRRHAGQQYPNVSRLMTVKSVAEYFGFSVSKVLRLEKKEPSFPRPVRIGGSKRWDRQAIDHYIDQLSSGR